RVVLAILRMIGVSWGSHRMGNATRGELQATMDHADIRGLVTALHRSVAGLPRSRVGDHSLIGGCPHSELEDSPHRVPRIALPIRCAPLTSWECPPIALVRWRSGARADLLADAPDKASQLPSDGHADLVVLQASGGERPVTVVQTQLRSPGDRAHGRGLLFLTLLKRYGDARREAVVPGRFDEHASGMAISGLGDRPETAFLPRGVLRRHQPQVAHQLARTSEALELSKFCCQSGGGQLINSAQRHQRPNQGAHPPMLKLLGKRIAQALNPCLLLRDRLAVLDEGDVLGVMDKGYRGQITLVRCRPGGLAR